MASELGSVPPPSCIAVAFVRTSLDTRLALDVLPTDSVSDLMPKITACHSTTFPSHGEIVVNSLKFKHRRRFYRLSDSMLVSSLLNQRGGDLHLFAQVSPYKEHLQRPAPLIHGQDSDGGGNQYTSTAIGGCEGNSLDDQPSGLEISVAPLSGSHGRKNDAQKCPILDKTNSSDATPSAVEGTHSLEPHEQGAVDVGRKKKRRKCALRKYSTKKRHLEGTKQLAKASDSLPEIEDSIDKEKMVGDTNLSAVPEDNFSRTERDMTMENESADIVIELGDKYPTFDLKKAVCNHGMFMTAPNRWIRETSTFQRPLRLVDESISVDVSISQHGCPSSRRLEIRIHDPHPLLSLSDLHIIQVQVCRMLRISERDEILMDKFHSIHPSAKRKGFGRIFRNPSIFEDAVKIFLFCKSDWERTLRMVRLLCVMQRKIANGEYHSQNNQKHDGLIGNFPSATEIIIIGEYGLREYCRVGFRAPWIFALAKKVVGGERSDVLGMLERRALRENSELLTPLKKRIKGMGNYAFNFLLMCVGFYNQVPGDTETAKHIRRVHEKRDCTMKNVQKYAKTLYKAYKPFESLAYWHDQVTEYESWFGNLWQLSPEKYHLVTGESR